MDENKSKPRAYQFLTLNENYVRFYEFFEKVSKRVSIEGYEIEIESKLNNRIVLKNSINSVTEDYSLMRDMLVKTSIDSQILRSRFVFMRNECFKYLKKLDDYLVNIKRYLNVEYRGQLEAIGIKTQTDKGYVIDSLFIEVERFLTELKILIDNLEFAIKDLDQSGYTVMNLVKMLELTFKNSHL